MSSSLARERDCEALLAENRSLREQLDGRARVAARALAAYQRRVERLSEALRSLEERDRRLSEDLEQAHLFQERLLTSPPVVAGLQIAASSRSVERVGGDLYDLSSREPGHLRVFIADAIGHGVQAALRTMILKGEYERQKLGASPEAVLSKMNARLVAMYPGLEMQCAALCLDAWAPTKEAPGSVRFASAALPALLQLSPGQPPREHYRPGALLGVSPNFYVESGELVLSPGDRLVMYSDGLIEEWDASGKAFGLPALVESLSAPLPLGLAVETLFEHLKAFVGPAGLADDATVVAIAADG